VYIINFIAPSFHMYDSDLTSWDYV